MINRSLPTLPLTERRGSVRSRTKSVTSGRGEDERQGPAHRLTLEVGTCWAHFMFGHLGLGRLGTFWHTLRSGAQKCNYRRLGTLAF